jgi:transcriptional regulator with XRE-family HTH domain
MRHRRQLREEAISLRIAEGLSLCELAERLAVSRSTIYYWVKGIPAVMNSQRQREWSEKLEANRKLATAAMQAKYAARRQTAYDAMYQAAPKLLEDTEVRDFVVLYLAEGYRKGRNSVQLSNSNPIMVRFAHKCMRRLSTNPHFYYSFQYHADQDPHELQAYWATCLGTQPERIKPIAKTNSGHLKGRRFACEHGVFQIQVSDTMFRAQLQALMDVVQEQWSRA